MYKFKNHKITKEEITEHPEQIILLVRPSMKGDLDRIGGIEGGALIYSMWEGYLEQLYTKSFENYIKERGISWYNIHTGGHATLEALKRIEKRLAPRMIVPIHTVSPQEFSKHFAKVNMLNDKEQFKV